jgi:hypothetical protein
MNGSKKKGESIYLGITKYHACKGPMLKDPRDYPSCTAVKGSSGSEVGEWKVRTLNQLNQPTMGERSTVDEQYNSFRLSLAVSCVSFVPTPSRRRTMIGSAHAMTIKLSAYLHPHPPPSLKPTHCSLQPVQLR